MKTDAIRKVLNGCRNGDITIMYLDALETAFTAKDAEITMLGTALGWLAEAASAYEADQSGCTDDRLGLTQPITKAEGVELGDALRHAENVLCDMPTGKVPVDLEKLREIETASLHVECDGSSAVAAKISRACPVCGKTGEIPVCSSSLVINHDANCWLGKLLKASE